MNPNKKRLLLFSFLGVFFLVVSLVHALSLGVKPETFQISFLDVGQGDAILVQTTDGIQVLIDAGPKSEVMAPLRQVMPSGDRTIDMIVLTNPDADHISGFLQVLDEYDIDTALVAGTRSTTATYKTLMQKIKQKDVKQLAAYKDMELSLGTDAKLDVLFPDQVVRGWERNDGSIVMRLTYGGTSVMLMGDATSETEKLILSNYPSETYGERITSDILKLGHHGSRTSTSEEWLDAVSPEIAIVSAGAGNRYGHPHPEVIDRLIDRGIQVRKTMEDGTITYESDGVSWSEKGK